MPSASFAREYQSALAEHSRGELDSAIRRYRALLKHRPGHAALLANLASALRQSGRRAEALELFARAVEAKGAPAETWFNYGNALAEARRGEDAERAYRQALLLEPNLHPAMTNLARLLAARGQRAEGLVLHERAVELEPRNAPSLRALATAAYEDGKLEDAERLYRAALDRAPKHADSLNALGVVLKDLGRAEEALHCWREVIRLEPRHSAAYNNLGAMLRLMRRPQEAIAPLRRALELAPADAMTAANLAHALLELGQTSEAETLARGVLQRDQGNADGHLMLGFSLAYQGGVEESIERFLAAHRLKPQSGVPISNALFASLYSDQRDAAQLLELHRGLACRIAPARVPYDSWNCEASANRRLRIGYLSPDLRGHPVSRFLEPVLGAHDGHAFEVHCYSTTLGPDETTARLRALVPHWHDCAGMSDERLADLIHSNAIDVLVDLAGHTAQNRAAVLRARPAPVQALYIGYPGTSGLPEVDWLIADERLCPRGHERFCSERVMRLKGSFWCYGPPEQAPGPAPAPAESNGFITFGSYNALQKLTATTVALWKRVLDAVPRSRLLLKSLSFADEGLRSRIESRFVEAGVAPGRVEAVAPTEPAKFLAEYGHIDIALDPLPYNGGTTTCEALWMGVPVITLAGERLAARMGASVLGNMGLDELVARDADQYVRIASELACDPGCLAGLRATLRARMAASPVCDAARTARELEQAYRRMVHPWRA